MKRTPAELRGVECPTCGARIGEPCVTASGGYLNGVAHRSRRTELGLIDPDGYDCEACDLHFVFVNGLLRHRFRVHEGGAG